MAPHEGIALLPPLTAAVVVCRAIRCRRKRRACALDGGDDAVTFVPADTLPDIVTHIVSTFLDYAHPKYWSMSRACERNLPLSLLPRLAARESDFWLEEGESITALAAVIASAKANNRHYRAFQFSKALVSAVAHDNLDVVKWLCGEYCPTGIVWKAMDEAARRGRTRILEWMATHHRGRIVWNIKLMELAAAHGHIATLEWFFAQPESGGCSDAAMNQAAMHGHLEVVKWLHEHYEDKTRIRFYETLQIAISYGHFEIARFLASHKYRLQVLLYDGGGHKWGENLEMAKWLHEHSMTGANAIDTAAYNGNMQVVQWLHEHQPDACSANAMDCAAENGHLDVVKWLHANRSEGCTVSAMNLAAAGGHLDVIQWLHEHRSEGCTEDAMDVAAENGHLPILEWLHKHRNEGCSVEAPKLAATRGHKHVLEWLHVHKPDVWSPRVMDAAASSGHLDIVQWLHTHRNEGCTTDALDKAARNNHFDVVKWLHANRSEGCTTSAMDLAGSCEMLVWLHENRSEGWSWSEGCRNIVNHFVTIGDFDALLFVRAHALKQGKTRFVWTLRVPLYTEQFEIFEWLCEQQRPSRDKFSQLRMTRSAEAYTMALFERVGG